MESIPVNTQTATMNLERSTNGRSYTSIYTVTATALRMMQPFSYTDYHPIPGINYYRLRSVDDNGLVTYSSMVALLNAKKGFELISISPNPVSSGKLNANISTALPVSIRLLITDLTGRTLAEKTCKLGAGYHTAEMNIENLPSGIYQLRCQADDTEPAILRFVKQ